MHYLECWDHCLSFASKFPWTPFTCLPRARLRAQWSCNMAFWEVAATSDPCSEGANCCRTLSSSSRMRGTTVLTLWLRGVSTHWHPHSQWYGRRSFVSHQNKGTRLPPHTGGSLHGGTSSALVYAQIPLNAENCEYMCCRRCAL